MAPTSHPIGLHFQKYDDFILQPVIRKDILNSNITNDNSYIVYLPSNSLSHL